jgi:hypothetical protein
MKNYLDINFVFALLSDIPFTITQIFFFNFSFLPKRKL